MKPYTFPKAALLLCFVLLSSSLLAQVKIGGDPKQGPHPSSVLELTSTDKGFLLPRLSDEQMQAVPSPADGLLIFNTTTRGIYMYSGPLQQWMPLIQQAARLAGDSCEWEYDTATSRVFLVRGYPLGDSVYYNLPRKKFVFADKRTLGNTSQPIDEQFPGKYYFKATASRLVHDSNSVIFPSLTMANFLYEVDNDSFALANPGVAFYNGIRVSTQLLPTATQQVATIRTLNLQLNHAGADSLGSATSVVSNGFVEGAGFTSNFTGFQNNQQVTSSATNNIGTIAGYRNTIGMDPTAGGRVLGNVFGYLNSFSGFVDSTGASKINGNAYGFFVNNVNIAAPRRNYAFYSNKGFNRYGDSTLITDGFFTTPRAVLDVNSTSAMIIPTGNTVQRPATGIAGMIRHNTDQLSPEYYDGSAWQSFGGSEWKFDAGTSRVNLVRGLPLGDSVYYSTDRRKFVFADKRTLGNTSQPIDEQFPGKYFFKGTASRLFHDANSLAFPSLTLANVLYEVDNDSFALANPGIAFYNGMRISTQLLPTATQKASTIRTMNLQLNHTGADSLASATSVVSNAFVDGAGYTGNLTGFQNNLVVAATAQNNIGTIAGYRNAVTMDPDASGRVLGNVFGYLNSFSGFVDSTGASKVNGNAYGVFINSVNIAAPKRNYAFYSNKGHNRFADSTLITDGFFTSPRAVLDVNSTSAMITPAGTAAQRPTAPVTAMLRYNTTGSNMEYFNGSAWKGFSSDTAEWKFDGASRVYMMRGLPAGDTIFYNPLRNNMVFADRSTNTNSLGSDFPVEDFGAKYTFKTTASKRDSTQFDGANTNIVYEVDNTNAMTLYNALSTSTVMNPKAFQKADQLSGITNTIIHAGNDSVQFVYGMLNTARNSGNGRSGSIIGIQNMVRIQNGNGNNTGEMVGFRNQMIRTGATAGRVTGNVYGWQGSFGGFANNVDGNMYGIFLGTVAGAGPSRNFAFYSNKGLNRLGDSLLVTDGAAINPRAVLDVNSTTAMIVPTGTTAQRPAAPVAGMVRYNTTNQTVEAYSGTQWNGIVRGTNNIDIPNMLVNSGATLTVTVTGATTGSAVSVSPTSSLPNGVIIAWARVSAANTVEIRFENNSGAPVNPAAQNFNIRVIQ